MPAPSGTLWTRLGPVEASRLLRVSSSSSQVTTWSRRMKPGPGQWRGVEVWVPCCEVGAVIDKLAEKVELAGTGGDVGGVRPVMAGVAPRSTISSTSAHRPKLAAVLSSCEAASPSRDSKSTRIEGSPRIVSLGDRVEADRPLPPVQVAQQRDLRAVVDELVEHVQDIGGPGARRRIHRRWGRPGRRGSPRRAPGGHPSGRGPASSRSSGTGCAWPGGAPSGSSSPIGSPGARRRASRGPGPRRTCRSGATGARRSW